MARYYPGLAGLGPLTVGRLVMLDELIRVTRKEEGLREHEYTPAGVYNAVLETTGDRDLADECRAAAELAELRLRGKK